MRLDLEQKRGNHTDSFLATDVTLELNCLTQCTAHSFVNVTFTYNFCFSNNKFVEGIDIGRLAKNTSRHLVMPTKLIRVPFQGLRRLNDFSIDFDVLQRWNITVLDLFTKLKSRSSNIVSIYLVHNCTKIKITHSLLPVMRNVVGSGVAKTS